MGWHSGNRKCDFPKYMISSNGDFLSWDITVTPNCLGSGQWKSVQDVLMYVFCVRWSQALKYMTFNFPLEILQKVANIWFLKETVLMEMYYFHFLLWFRILARMHIQAGCQQTQRRTLSSLNSTALIWFSKVLHISTQVFFQVIIAISSEDI